MSPVTDFGNKLKTLFKDIDFIGLFLIGTVSLVYSLFERRFAELHISLPFLNFPIFIGEILVFICFFLFVSKGIITYRKSSIKLKPITTFLKQNWRYLLLLIYFGFVLIKAFHGYFKWGPLAFRHAALFYYPIFAIFCYSFYKRKIFDKRIILSLVIISILAVKFVYLHIYFLVTFFFLSVILIKAYPDKFRRYLFYLVLLAITPYVSFFRTARTMLVSNMAAIAYVLILLLIILNIKKIHKLTLCVFLLLFIFIMISTKTAQNDLRSLYDFKKFIASYNNFHNLILTKKDSFEAEEVKYVKLYNPEVKSTQSTDEDAQLKLMEIQFRKKELELESRIREKEDEIKGARLNLSEREIQMAKVSQPQEMKPEIQESQNEIKEVQLQAKENQTQIEDPQPINLPEREIQMAKVSQPQEMKPEVQEVQIQKEKDKLRIELIELKSQKKKLQSQLETLRLEKIKKTQSQEEVGDQIQQKPVSGDLGTAYASSLFRIFIWEDILIQLKQEKPILGFDFGKPFRSKNIEILGIASGDWKREGWISIHNGYLNIIYRAGIIGFLCILTIFVILFRMMKISINLKSITGVLLCGILINWLVAANFLEILELPYTAVPFWSLFGVTLAFFNKK